MRAINTLKPPPSPADRSKTVDLDPWGTGLPLLHTGPSSVTLLRAVTVFGLTIRAGYQFDGASVPRAFYNVLARFTDGLPAALVHDYRYDPLPDPDGVKRRQLTRQQADQEFYRNLRASGVNFVRAQAAYRAVRLAGGIPWSKGTKKGIVNP